MIGYLEGTPRLTGKQLLVVVGGVGYEVHVPQSVLATAPSQDTVQLFIHTHVREDALQLFGFDSKEHQELFELLLSVSGVGPSTALAITNLPSDQIIQAVQQADIKVFTSIPRVGKKLAQKIVIDLRSKLGELKQLDLSPRSTLAQQVIEALVSLGFAELDSEQALEDIDLESLSLEEAITQTIKKLGKK